MDRQSSYARTRGRLEEIVAQVKAKDVSLEKSLDLYEEALRLGSTCAEMIDRTDFSAEELESAGATGAEDAEDTEDAKDAESVRDQGDVGDGTDAADDVGVDADVDEVDADEVDAADDADEVDPADDADVPTATPLNRTPSALLDPPDPA